MAELILTRNFFCGLKKFNKVLEIYITSIDKDGTLNGPDLDLIEYVKNSIKIPTVYGGGISCQDDITKLRDFNFLSGVSISSGLYKLDKTVDFQTGS